MPQPAAAASRVVPKALGNRGRRPKPKPVVPITDAMADGREPMRTFSDLQQFFKKKRENDRPEPDTPGEGA